MMPNDLGLLLVPPPVAGAAATAEHAFVRFVPGDSGNVDPGGPESAFATEGAIVSATDVAANKMRRPIEIPPIVQSDTSGRSHPRRFRKPPSAGDKRTPRQASLSERCEQ